MSKRVKSSQVVNQKKKKNTQARAIAPARSSHSSKGLAPGLMGGVGSALGSLVGLGGLGKSAGDWFGKVTGMGDYKVKNNSMVDSAGLPLFIKGGGLDEIVVTHREYFADVFTGPTLISATTQFNVTSYPVNPGQASMFPWLSEVAINFEQYSLEGCLVEFKSTSADALNSTNTALGEVIISTQYDSYDAPFLNKQQMDAYEFTQSTKPSCDAIHPLECKPRLNTLATMYVRPTSQTTSQGDLRMYDLGKLYVATNGMQAANVNIGELWVSYKVRLIRPKLLDSATSTSYVHYAYSGVTTGVPTNTQVLYSGDSSLCSAGPAGTITFNRSGTYIVTYGAYCGAAATSSFSTWTGSANVAIVPNHYINSTVSTLSATPTTAGGTLVTVCEIIVGNVAPGSVSQLTLTGFTSSGTGNADLIIQQMQPSLTNRRAFSFEERLQNLQLQVDKVAFEEEKYLEKLSSYETPQPTPFPRPIPLQTNEERATQNGLVRRFF